MDETAIKQAGILVVDDQAPNVRLLESLLEVSGFTNVVGTTDSTEVVGLCAAAEPDLVLLDLQMPPPDGFAVLELLAPWTHGPTALPILVLTADTTREAKMRALGLGARDFLNKPFDTTEVVLRVRNLLEVRLLQRELRAEQQALEQRVRERTRELEEARIEIIERLALVAEYRDDAHGRHPQRVGRVAALLAGELGLPEDTVELIRRAATLHDVGMVGVPEAVLLKAGSLTPLELEAVKIHVSIGAEILGRSRTRLLQMAEQIALTHHERWDGSGYLAGLKGEEIPLPGRLVAVAHAFDELAHRRPANEAARLQKALGEIRAASGRQFDPQIVQALERLDAGALLESRDLASVA